MIKKFLASTLALAIAALSVPQQAAANVAAAARASRVNAVPSVASLGSAPRLATPLAAQGFRIAPALGTTLLPAAAAASAAPSPLSPALTAAPAAAALGLGSPVAAQRFAEAAAIAGAAAPNLVKAAAAAEQSSAYFDQSSARATETAAPVAASAQTGRRSLLNRARAGVTALTTAGMLALPALASAQGLYGSPSDEAFSIAGIPVVTAVKVVAAVAGVLVIALNSFVNVGGTQIAMLERRWLGKEMPQGRVVAMGSEVGIQARILGPGLKFLFPFLYKVKKDAMIELKEDEIGLVEAIDGVPVPAGRIFAKTVQGHDFFQNGEGFLQNGGEKGPQMQVLPPGQYRINPYLFRVTREQAVQIPDGQIGVVVAQDGAPIEPGRLLAKSVGGHDNFQNADSFLNNGGQKGPQMDILLPGTYRINRKLFDVKVMPATEVPTGKVGLVTARDGAQLPKAEYMAKETDGHRDFQDGAAFLQGGGQRGPQTNFLKPGRYYINPYMFELKLDNVTEVQRGEVAVIVSNTGMDPTKDDKAVKVEAATPEGQKPAEGAAKADDRLGPGVERYVVDPGYRGIQREVAGPGRYHLNTMANTPHIIPTTNITIDWADEKENGKSDAEKIFNPLAIVSKDGFEMTIAVKVILRVLPEMAPMMVARIGTIENLIQHVVHPLIDSSFRNQASSTEAMRFMQDRHEQQKDAEEMIREGLKKYYVEVVGVLISQINLPDDLMKTLTQKVVAEQQRTMYDAQKITAERRKEMERTTAEANQQSALVGAEIGVKIAAQDKEKAITQAQGEGEATKLRMQGEAAGIAAKGRAEAESTEAIGRAVATAYTEQRQALGPEALAAIEIMKQIAEGKIKITPDILVSGGQGSDGSTGVMGALVAQMLARQIAPETPPAPPAGPATPKAGGTDKAEKK